MEPWGRQAGTTISKPSTVLLFEVVEERVLYKVYLPLYILYSIL